jgi:hypothetical protein
MVMRSIEGNEDQPEVLILVDLSELLLALSGCATMFSMEMEVLGYRWGDPLGFENHSIDFHGLSIVMVNGLPTTFMDFNPIYYQEWAHLATHLYYKNSTGEFVRR